MTKRWIASAQAEAAGQLSLVFDNPVQTERNPLRHRRNKSTRRLDRRRLSAQESGHQPASPEKPEKAGGVPPSPPESSVICPSAASVARRPESDVILKLRAVMAKTGLGRSTIYAWVKLKRFPEQVSLGPGAVGWSQTEIDCWLDARKRERESRQA